MISHPASDRVGAADERGVSLIELIAVVALIGIVFGGLAAVVMGIWSAQRAVTETTQATTQADAVSAALDRALRNAQAVEISDGGATLRVRTSLTGQNRCQGFAVDGGDLLVQQSADALPERSEWTQWVTTAAESAAPVFTMQEAKIAYAFTLTVDDTALVVEGAVAPRTPSGGATPCWPE